MKRLSTVLLHLMALTLFGSLAVAVPTNAQSGGIGGKPANPDSSNERTKSIFIKQLVPGQTATDAIEIINNTDVSKSIAVYSVDSVPSSGGAFACAQAVDKKSSVGSWIEVSQQTVRLNARESLKVPFTISVPERASVGEQNGCIVLQEQKEATIQGGIGLSFRTAIRIAVLVPGEVQKTLQATGISVKKTATQIIVTPSAKNTGNVSLDTSVATTIKTVLGTTVSRQENTFPILRDQLTHWNFEFKKLFWGGFYRVGYSLTYDETKEQFLNAHQQVPKTINGPAKTVFVTPHPAALVLELLILTLLIFLLYVVKRNRSSQSVVANQWQNYKVCQGDDIQSVAKHFGTNWKVLAKNNNLKPPYSLKPDSILKVPSQKVKQNRSNRNPTTSK